MRWRSPIGLLVAGWYLITPPFVGGNIDKRALLSQRDEEARLARVRCRATDQGSHVPAFDLLSLRRRALPLAMLDDISCTDFNTLTSLYRR
jgi:hypothetical protein